MFLTFRIAQSGTDKVCSSRLELEGREVTTTDRRARDQDGLVVTADRSCDTTCQERSHTYWTLLSMESRYHEYLLYIF